MLTVIKNPKTFDWKNADLNFLLLGNAYDSSYTHRLLEKLNIESEGEHYKRVYESLVQPSIQIYAELGNMGMNVDQVELEAIRQRLEEDIEKLLQKMQEFAPDLNFNSDKQVMEFLFLKEVDIEKIRVEWVPYKTKATIKKHDGVLGRNVNKKYTVTIPGLDLEPDTDFKTDTGLPSVSKDAVAFYIVKALDRKDEKAETFLKTLKEYKQLSKLHGTYAIGIHQALTNTGDGRVYSRYKLDGTVTGRLSCAAATRGNKKEDKLGVSFHTLPREKRERYNVRAVFTTDKHDEDFICADFSTMELRILAHCSQDPFMLKAFNERMDLHTFTASLVNSKTMEDVLDAERSIAKTINFLSVYGGGIKKLASSCELPMSLAKHVKKRHEEVFARSYAWLKEIEGFVKSNKYAISLFGRYRRLPDVSSSDTAIVHSCLRKGKNFVIQSSASDVLVAANIEIYKFLKKTKFPARIVANVHDSIEIICKKTHTAELLPLLKAMLIKPKLLKEAFNLELSVPLEVEFEVGHSFGSAEKVLV